MFDAEPVGWEQTTLGMIVTLGGGTTPPKSQDFYWTDGAIPWATPSDITALPPGESRISATKIAITERALKECSLPLNPPGTVLMTSRATIGYAALNTVPMTTNQGFITFRCGDKADPEFLLHWLTAKRDLLVAAAGGSTFKELSKGTTKLLPISLPPLDEQRRIAEVLRSVDEAHRLSDLTLTHLRLLRTLALRDLFTAGNGEEFEDTILGPLPLGWTATAAEDVCEAVIDCKNRTPPVTERGFAVVRTPNVRNGRFVRHNLLRTDPGSFEEWTSRGRPRVGDVLITREAPIGEVCAVPEDEPICLGQRMMLYRPKPTKLDSSFLLYALQSQPVQDHLRNLGGGSTVGHVRVGDVRRLPIPCPDITTQKAVAKALEEIDEALDRAAESVVRTGSVKNALAVDLLSGRVRVPA